MLDNPLAALLGRILVSALFLPSGVAKLTGFVQVTTLLETKGLPMPSLLVGAVIALEVLGSLAIVLGWQARAAALLLAAFSLAAGAIFHAYWAAPLAEVFGQRQAFFKNLGIAGGLLVLAAFGPGRLSLDAREVSHTQRK